MPEPVWLDELPEDMAEYYRQRNPAGYDQWESINIHHIILHILVRILEALDDLAPSRHQ